jgi:SAM-dependent methyltransferase
MLDGPAAYRDVWNRKPALRAVYADIYERILQQCVPGQTLEVGGGSGNFKAFAPRSISTDITFAPWLDVVCDAQRMPFPDNAFDNLVMVDVLHHIESPLSFFQEAQRVLRPGGRLIFCEPAITPLSSVFYRLFHEEPFDMTVNPLLTDTISADKSPWDSNQAIPTLLVGRFRTALAAQIHQLEFANVDFFSFLAYPLSGGFKSWSLLPGPVARPLLAIEWSLRKLLGKIAGFRLLAVYRK